MVSKKILIQYTNTNYYKKMLAMIENEIKKSEHDIEIQTEFVQGFSGAFEVALVKNKTYKMLHSKLSTGESLTIDKMPKLIEDIINL